MNADQAQEFCAVVPDGSFWNLEEFSKSPKRLRIEKNELLDWDQLQARGHGKLLGVILRIDKLCYSKAIYYIKSHNNLGTLKGPIADNLLIGSFVVCSVVELRSLESVPQINQMICTIPKLAIANLIKEQQTNDLPKGIIQFPWESSTPILLNLAQAANQKSKFIRIRLTIKKITNVTLKDGHETYQCVTIDGEGSQAYLELSSEKIRLSSIQVNSCLIISDCSVICHDQLYSVYPNKATLLEILSTDSKEFFNTDQLLLDSVNSPASLEDAFHKLQKIPSGCEETIKISGYITQIGIGSASCIVQALCDHCKNRFTVQVGRDLTCKTCGPSNMECAKWKLSFNCPISISDHIDTIKGLYLNGIVANDFFGFPPSSYLRFCEEHIASLRQKLFFEKVHCDVKIKALEKDRKGIAILSISMEDTS